jgi:hypothetical protein
LPARVLGSIVISCCTPPPSSGSSSWVIGVSPFYAA